MSIELLWGWLLASQGCPKQIHSFASILMYCCVRCHFSGKPTGTQIDMCRGEIECLLLSLKWEMEEAAFMWCGAVGNYKLGARRCYLRYCNFTRCCCRVWICALCSAFCSYLLFSLSPLFLCLAIRNMNLKIIFFGEFNCNWCITHTMKLPITLHFQHLCNTSFLMTH